MSELTIQALMNSQVLTMSSREIAELTGKQHKNVKRDIEVMLNDLQEDALRFEHIYMDSMNRPQTEYLLDRDHTECLLTGYSAIHRMRVIRRWHELESVNAAAMVQTLTDKVQAGIAMLSFYKQELRIAPSAMLGAMKKLQSSLGMPDILPAYAVDAPDGSTTGSSEVTHSLTELLLLHGKPYTAQSGFKRLQLLGLVERKSRPSTKHSDKEKTFWSLTEKGLQFGKNLTDPANPRQTQPHFYDSQFRRLLAVMTNGAAA